MTDLTPEDIAAARQDGDLVALLLMAAGLAPAVPKQRTPTPEPDNVHIAYPGAWPTGTRRPTPVPPASGPEITAAIADYSRWLAAGRPTTSTRCPCPGCALGGIT